MLHCRGILWFCGCTSSTGALWSTAVSVSRPVMNHRGENSPGAVRLHLTSAVAVVVPSSIALICDPFHMMSERAHTSLMYWREKADVRGGPEGLSRPRESHQIEPLAKGGRTASVSVLQPKVVFHLINIDFNLVLIQVIRNECRDLVVTLQIPGGLVFPSYIVYG